MSGIALLWCRFDHRPGYHRGPLPCLPVRWTPTRRCKRRGGPRTIWVPSGTLWRSGCLGSTMGCSLHPRPCRRGFWPGHHPSPKTHARLERRRRSHQLLDLGHAIQWQWLGGNRRGYRTDESAACWTYCCVRRRQRPTADGSLGNWIYWCVFVRRGEPWRFYQNPASCGKTRERIYGGSTAGR